MFEQHYIWFGSYLGNEVVVLCVLAGFHDTDDCGFTKVATVLFYRGRNAVI